MVHNPLVTSRLQQLGVQVVERVEDARGGLLILRSHGVAPQVLSACRENGVDYVDCTCARVRALHERAAAYSAGGLPVVLVGDGEHPEVRGTAGWCQGPVYTVYTAEDVAALPPLPRALVASQTTLPMERWQARCQPCGQKFPSRIFTAPSARQRACGSRPHGSLPLPATA